MERRTGTKEHPGGKGLDPDGIVDRVRRKKDKKGGGEREKDRYKGWGFRTKRNDRVDSSCCPRKTRKKKGVERENTNLSFCFFTPLNYRRLYVNMDSLLGFPPYPSLVVT